MSHKSETNDDSELERGRAILTPNDRKFLADIKEFEEAQQESNARYRIRNRVTEAIQDLAFLQKNLDEDDLDMIFEDLVENDRETVVQAVAFLIRGVDDIPDDIIGAESFIHAALTEAACKKFQEKLVTVDFDYDREKKERDIDEAKERLLADNGTFRDLEFLLQQDELPLLELGKREPIQLKPHYGSEENGEEFSVDDLVTLGISKIQEREHERATE